MKLLLTSAGITNKAIGNAVVELSGLSKEKIRLCFVPTAANVEDGDKGWLIDDLKHFQAEGYESIDIVDITALEKEQWLERLKVANVICFGGGDEQYLVEQMRATGFIDKIPTLFENRLYIGISAGSMVMGKLLQGEALWTIYPDDRKENEGEKGLEYTNCYFLPHLNSPHFPAKRKEIIEQLKGKLDAPLYALDDHSALKIDGEEIVVIGSGKVEMINT